MRKLRVVVSLITDDNDYQLQQAAAAKECAARLGLELQTLFAQNDAIRQSQQLLDIIQFRDSRVDGILVEPAGRTAFPKIAQAAVASGIAWIVLNCEADYLANLRSGSVLPAFAVSADNYEVGRIQGRQLGAILPKGGLVLYIQGPSLSSATEQRTAGMLETKPQNVNLKKLKSTNWSEDAAFHAVASWLRLSTAQREQVHVVQAQNDCLAMGARRAIEQHRGAQSIAESGLPYLGVDGLPRTGQAWVRQGTLTATIVVPPVTSYALSAFVAMMQGGMPPPARRLIAPESFPALDELRAKFLN
jgi:ABC-type sugar transport system substrate-binding protein